MMYRFDQPVRQWPVLAWLSASMAFKSASLVLSTTRWLCSRTLIDAHTAGLLIGFSHTLYRLGMAAWRFKRCQTCINAFIESKRL